MTPGVVAAIAYGILAIIGGILGYVQARSKISLVAGCGLGTLLLISAFLHRQGQAWGLVVATVITLVLILAFFMRWQKTRKFMPAGLMLLLGIPSLALMVSELIQR